MSQPVPAASEPRQPRRRRMPRRKRQPRIIPAPGPKEAVPTGPRARARVTRSGLTPTQIKEMIATALDQEHKRVDCGPSGRAWIDLVSNPTRDGLGPDSVKSTMVRWPDGKANTTALVLTSVGTFAGSTATSGIIACYPPVVSDAHVYCFYGGDVMDSSSSPTNKSWLTNPEQTMFDVLAPLGTKFRYFTGLKVKATSPADSTSGSLQGGNWYGNLFGTNLTTFSTYSSAITSLESNPQPVSEGITVRTNISADGRNFHSMVDSPTGASPTTMYDTYGYRPVVRFTGLAATTVLSITAVTWIEIITQKTTSCIPSSLTPLEPEFEQMVDFVNNQVPLITGGNSFKSFFQDVGKTVKSIFRFVDQNKSAIVGAGRLLAKIV